MCIRILFKTFCEILTALTNFYPKDSFLLLLPKPVRQIIYTMFIIMESTIIECQECVKSFLRCETRDGVNVWRFIPEFLEFVAFFQVQAFY